MTPTPEQIAALKSRAADVLHIVFDGPPGPNAGRFVEVETPDGRSVNAGEWHEREDGLWELRLFTRAAIIKDQPNDQ